MALTQLIYHIPWAFKKVSDRRSLFWFMPTAVFSSNITINFKHDSTFPEPTLYANVREFLEAKWISHVAAQMLEGDVNSFWRQAP